MIGAAASALTTATAADRPTTATAISSDFQTFLKMLTAQMQNQDPLNPIESSDYATQLATFSGVEQQVRTNQLLEALASQSGLGGISQLSGWVGMEARVAAPARFSGTPLTLYPAPDKTADRTVLVAYDAQNREVRRDLLPLSTDPVQWAGTDTAGNALPPGVYSFRLESYAGDTLVADSLVESYARITEIRAGSTGAVVVLDSGAEALADDVTALRAASG